MTPRTEAIAYRIWAYANPRGWDVTVAQHKQETTMTENEPMLGRSANILCSGERGQIIGRAEYLTQEPQYLIRYKAADGRATEQWWNISAVSTD